jgi:hypothetical protein
MLRGSYIGKEVVRLVFIKFLTYATLAAVLAIISWLSLGVVNHCRYVRL